MDVYLNLIAPLYNSSADLFLPVCVLFPPHIFLGTEDEYLLPVPPVVISRASMVPSIKEKAIEPTEFSAAASVIEINEAVGYDHSATKKLLRKLDWHIIPFMSLIYL